MESLFARIDLDPRLEARQAAPEAPVSDLAEREPDAASRRDERYRTLYDHFPLMVFRVDRGGNVLSVNEYGARELGYASGELVDRSVLEVFHSEDRRAAERQLGWVLDSPGEVARWELRKVRKDGTVLWVRETVRVIEAPNGVPEILVVCEDVSERRRAVQRLGEARDQLRDLNAELARLEEREQRRIARVLHDEVGQTLAVARMTVCELRESEGSKDRADRLLKVRDLVDQTIKATRSLTVQLSPPMLHDLGLAAALEALGEHLEEDHGIRFVFEPGEGWPPTAEDTAVVLYRVVRELFHNVTKHARSSRARLELNGTGDRIWIVVEDDGVGFDADSGGAGNGHAGRSLGLFHVREQVERLGGRFEIDSAPGRGTRARLTLPHGEGAERRRSDRRTSP